MQTARSSRRSLFACWWRAEARRWARGTVCRCAAEHMQACWWRAKAQLLGIRPLQAATYTCLPAHGQPGPGACRLSQCYQV